MAKAPALCWTPPRFRFHLSQALVLALLVLGVAVVPAECANVAKEESIVPTLRTESDPPPWETPEEPSRRHKADKSSVCLAPASQGFLISSPDATERNNEFRPAARGSWMTTPTDPPLQLLALCPHCLEQHFGREADLLTLMKGIIRRQVAVAGSALMVDAGANHAVYGLTAAALGADVVAIEPQKGLIGNIIASAEKNKLQSRVFLHQNAILDVRGAARITAMEGQADGGLATVAEGGEGTLCSLPLDDVIRHRNVTFLKIDVEGVELRALRSGNRAFRAGRVRNILVEFGPPKRWLESARKADGASAMLAMYRLGFSTWLAPSQCTNLATTQLDLPQTTVHGVSLSRLSPSHVRPLISLMNNTGTECYVFWTLDKY